jgi:hypothetical protein
MIMSLNKTTLAALGFAAVLAAVTTVPASAAPISSAGVRDAAATIDPVTDARSERKARRHSRAYRAGTYGRVHQPHEYYHGGRGPDTIGSLGYDGYGYAYNRFSGQRYQSCVFDEGYGRTRPCDAGGGGGGRN